MSLCRKSCPQKQAIRYFLEENADSSYAEWTKSSSFQIFLYKALLCGKKVRLTESVPCVGFVFDLRCK